MIKIVGIVLMVTMFLVNKSMLKSETNSFYIVAHAFAMCLCVMGIFGTLIGLLI